METQEEKNDLWKYIIWAVLRLAEDDGYDLTDTAFIYSPDIIAEFNNELQKDITVAHTVRINKDMWNGKEEEVKIDGQTKMRRCGGIREQFDFEDHYAYRTTETKFKENEDLLRLLKLLTKNI